MTMTSQGQNSKWHVLTFLVSPKAADVNTPTMATIHVYTHRVGLNNGGGTFKITSMSGSYTGGTPRTDISVVFTNTSISDTTASRGGALFAYQYEAYGHVNVFFEDTRVTSAGASVDGGTLAVEFNKIHSSPIASTNVSLAGNSSIDGGRVGGNGGAMSVLRSPLKLSMQGSSRIANMTSKGAGGAVYVRQHPGPVEILMQGNATIANCSASEGGAVSTSQLLVSSFGGDLFAGEPNLVQAKRILCFKETKLISSLAFLLHAGIKGGSSSATSQANASSLLEERAERPVLVRLRDSALISGCSAVAEKGGALSVTHAPFGLAMVGRAQLQSNRAERAEGGTLALATSISVGIQMSGDSGILGSSGSSNLASIIYVTNTGNAGGAKQLPIINVKLTEKAGIQGNQGLGLAADGVAKLDVALQENGTVSNNAEGGVYARQANSVSLSLVGSASLSGNNGPAVSLNDVATASISMANSSSISSNKAAADAGISMVAVRSMQV